MPVLTKQRVIEHFGELVTDPTVELTDVEAHLATLSGGDELFNGRYSGLCSRYGALDAAPDDPTSAAGNIEMRKGLRRR